MENETNIQDEPLNVAGTASPLKAENVVIRRTMREQAFEKYPVRPQSAPVDIPARTFRSANYVRQAHYWGSPTPHNTPEELKLPRLSPLSDISERSDYSDIPIQRENAVANLAYPEVLQNFRAIGSIASGGERLNWQPLETVAHIPAPKSPSLSPKSK